MTTKIVNETDGKIRVLPTGMLPIYAPGNLYSESTAARTQVSTRQNTTTLTTDSPNPMIVLDTNNVRTNPKVPDYTFGDPQHYHTVLAMDEANPSIILDPTNVRTNPKLADYMLGDPQHTHVTVREDRSVASVSVTGRKVRSGFFSPALSNDLPLAFNSNKFVPGIYAPELPSSPGERATIYAPGTAPVKKRT